MSEKIYSVEEIKKIINEIIKNNYSTINKVILFGSYSRGEANRISDIDLFVVDSPEFIRMKTIGFSSLVKERLGKDVDLFIEKNVNKESNFYKNIMKDGLVIYE